MGPAWDAGDRICRKWRTHLNPRHQIGDLPIGQLIFRRQFMLAVDSLDSVTASRMSGWNFLRSSFAARFSPQRTRLSARRHRRLLAEPLESRAMLTVPTAVDDYFETSQDTAITISATSLSANDLGGEGGSLEVALVLGSGPLFGKLSVGNGGNLIYTPGPGFYGDDRFNYFAFAGNQYSQSQATVNIHVKQSLSPIGGIVISLPNNLFPGQYSCFTAVAPTSAPLANGECYVTAEDTPLTLTAPGLLTNDFDGDRSSLTAALESKPAHGEVSIDTDGGFTYLPAQDYFGSDEFAYRLSNNGELVGIARVSIEVTPVNDAPVVRDDTFSTESGLPLFISVGDLLANDSDVEGDHLTLVMSVNKAPTNAVLALQDGGIAFTPRLGFHGTDGFDYLATDGQVFSPVPAHVSVTTTAPVRHNSRVAVDVDNDFHVTANDALLIINCINSIGSGAVARLANYSRDLLDVDSDSEVTASDVLAVINAINSGQFEAESEAEADAGHTWIAGSANEPATPASPASSLALIDLIACDTAEQIGRRRVSA
jgi:hypothetical protein